MEDIRLNGGVLKDAIQHITPEAVKGSGLFEPYSIILATTATIGEHAMLIADSLANQRFTNFKIRKSLTYKYNPYYLYYYFFKIDKWCLKNTNAGGLLSVDIPSLKRQKLYSPSVEEQNKIAKLLRLIDDRISIQSRIIEKYETLIKGIRNLLLYSNEGKSVRLGDILIERFEKTKLHNQYEVLSSTVKGIFSQREYFSKDIASDNNAGYKIIRLYDVVMSPQNLWMGNINYNDKFEIGIVSPSYRIYSIAKSYDKRFVEAMLKTHRALYNYILVSEQGASIVRRNLNLEAFYELTFKIPPIEKQEKIGNVISALQSRLEAAVNFKTAYELQKQYLLSQMFI